MIRNKIKLQAGKTYTVNDASSTYTIIVGDMREAPSTFTEDAASSLSVGAGSPSLELGKIGGIYLDHINKKVHVKDASGWDSGFDLGGSGGSSEFKVGAGAPSLNLSSSISAYIDMQSMTFHTRSGGSWDEGRLMRGNAGSSGQNGKSVRFGSGPPIASLGTDDETYIDLSDFKIHTKSSGAWSGGQVFRGNNGNNGKSIRFGSGLPSDGDGEDDEVYLDLTSFKVHSKSAGSWGSGHVFKGSDGAAGLNGKSIKFGNGAPSESDGDDDEVYLDLSNFKVHSKSLGTWGSGFAFKGDNGQDGLNGKSVRFGSGPPIASLGDDDEAYIDLNDFKIHTKSAGSWSSGNAFKGSNGQNGKSVKFGNGLPSDTEGEDDEIYLDLSNFKIHSKSAGSWGSGHEFKGASGSNGLNGKSVRFGNGTPANDVGDDDEVYFDLSNFKVHAKSSGSWSGGQLFKGDNGSNGQNGINGKSLRFGNGAPSDTDGDDDEVYLDLSSFKVHSKSAGSWGAGLDFRGNDGQNGLNGKSVRFGSGSPSDSLGDDDEVYFDLNDFKVHTKSSGYWDGGSAFKGNDGTPGLNGKSIRFGNGTPSASDGDDDEVYLDLSSFKIHSKSAGSWGTGLAFKGNDGLNGNDGADGTNGKDGIAAQLTNDSDVIPTDSDGTGYDFTDTGGEFELRSGGSKITSGVTYYAGAAGTSSSVAVNGLTLSIASDGAYSLSGASWTQSFAKFTMRAIHNGVTYTKVYKVTKARGGVAGANGANGINGTNGLPGRNGSDGADGSDALTGYLSNESDSVAAANDGTGYSLVGRGGTYYVYAGKTQVSPSNFYVGAVGTATSQTISGLTLSITSGGAYSLSGASWTTDSVSFTLRAIYSGVTLSKIYKITKSKAGGKGDQGIKGDIGATGPGVKVYSVALGSDSSTADVQLTTSYADMYLADVMTNEGGILSATVSKSSSSFTISETGRYRVELQASFRAKNSSTISSYSTSGYVKILKDGSTFVESNVSLSALTATTHLGPGGVIMTTPKYGSGMITLDKKVRLLAGTVLKIQAKTTSTTADKLTYLELATDSETQTAEDTILTITKL